MSHEDRLDRPPADDPGSDHSAPDFDEDDRDTLVIEQSASDRTGTAQDNDSPGFAPESGDKDP